MMEQIDFGSLHDSTFDNLLEGFQLISFDWVYLYVNEASLKQSRYSAKEDLLGYTMMEKYPGIEKTELFKTLKQCMKQRISKTFESEFTFPDNSRSWFELRIEPVPRGLFILSIDISRHKKMEQEKKEYAESLEKMLYMTSHEVRQPVAHCLGIINVIDVYNPSKEELLKIYRHLQDSAVKLDAFTKKLTAFIYDLKLRNKVESWA